jgi:hypothetical protein
VIQQIVDFNTPPTFLSRFVETLSRVAEVLLKCCCLAADAGEMADNGPRCAQNV